MIEKYYFEFSKIYGRLMRLEMRIKQRVVSSVLPYYKDDVLEVFKKFFENKNRLERYNNKNGNSFRAIIKNPQITTASQKFLRLINIMYLSDVLFLVLCCKQFHEKEIIDKFYVNVPEKFSELTSSRLLITDLRNAIAHYNFKDYEQNKVEYIDALFLFEYYLGNNIKGINEFPRFPSKPSVRNILLTIKELRPDLLDVDVNKDDEMEYYYNKHRILLDLCDDIAIYNGYTPSDLPSPWTILREMYAIKKATKIEVNTDIYDLPLFCSLDKDNS